MVRPEYADVSITRKIEDNGPEILTLNWTGPGIALVTRGALEELVRELNAAHASLWNIKCESEDQNA